MKKCTKCNIEKELSEFYVYKIKQDQTILFHSRCKFCFTAEIKIRYHAKSIEERQKTYSNSKRVRKYISKHNEWKMNKLHTDNLFKLKANLRTLIRSALNRKNYKKSTKTDSILGCSYEEFKVYLESKFKSWMNWDNYGNKKGIAKEINFSWDIDHIIPIKSANTEEEVLKLNHYSNLQPLCSFTNRNIKKGKY